MDKLNQLQDLLSSAKEEGERFYGKGNRAAGTRLRGKMQQIKFLATEIRKDVTEKKNA